MATRGNAPSLAGSRLLLPPLAVALSADDLSRQHDSRLAITAARRARRQDVVKMASEVTYLSECPNSHIISRTSLKGMPTFLRDA
jgi:hypothetical protein